MNIDQKIAELDKHIQYIEKVLKERPLVTRRLRLKMVALPLVVDSYLHPELKDNS
jgi:hypothetical protein